MMTSSVVEMQMTSPTEGTPTGVQLPEFSQLVSPPLVTHVRSHVPGNPEAGADPLTATSSEATTTRAAAAAVRRRPHRGRTTSVGLLHGPQRSVLRARTLKK